MRISTSCPGVLGQLFESSLARVSIATYRRKRSNTDISVSVPQKKVRLADGGYERFFSGLVPVSPFGKGLFELRQCSLHRCGRSGQATLLICGPTGESVRGNEALDRMFHSR